MQGLAFLKMRNKKGTLLTENLVFIILNLVFFAILIIFIFLKSSSGVLIQERTSKQIALIIDAAKPGTEIKLNVGEALDKAKKNSISNNDAIKIDNNRNLVKVKLSKESYYEYCFFNDVDVVYSITGDFLNMKIK